MYELQLVLFQCSFGIIDIFVKVFFLLKSIRTVRFVATLKECMVVEQFVQLFIYL